MSGLLGLSRATKAALIVLILLVLGFTGYYLWDKYNQEATPSVLGTEAERIEEYLQDNPLDTDAWIALAGISLQQRQYDKAISHYQTALDLDQDIAAAYMGLGLAYMKKGKSDRAVDNLTQAIALGEDPEIERSGISLGTAHYYLGKVYLEKGDLEQAFEELTLALAYNRTNADAIFLLGQVHEAQGNVDEAEAQYTLALRLVPNFAEAYVQFGKLYRGQGDILMAEYNETMAMLFSGSVTEAISQFQELAVMMPDNAEVHWGMGWGYEKLNMREEAIAAYEEAVRANPDHLMASGALERLGAGMR